jgi:hypothetical protein
LEAITNNFFYAKGNEEALEIEEMGKILDLMEKSGKSFIKKSRSILIKKRRFLNKNF